MDEFGVRVERPVWHMLPNENLFNGATIWITGVRYPLYGYLYVGQQVSACVGHHIFRVRWLQQVKVQA